MRSFPRNSPEAAARIVALVLICDGHVCRSELDALDRLQIEHALALDPGAFPRIVHQLCEDLLACAGDDLTGSLDEDTLHALLAEVDDPALQGRVLRLADGAARADRHLSDAEERVLAAAASAWGLQGTIGARAEPLHRPLAASPAHQRPAPIQG
ncbi:MAG: hypothetical protein RLZZ524_1679 [Pseudomonadota bacterium]